MDADLIVIGGGIVGLGTAWEALRAEQDVLLIEADRPGAQQSGGDTRIFRLAHPDPAHVPLAVAARSGWLRWSHDFGKVLLDPCGLVVSGKAALEQAPILEAAGSPGRWIDEEEARQLLPGPAPSPALFDGRGGRIWLAQAVAALAEALGPRIVCAQAVSVTSRAQGAVVALSDGAELAAKRVVVCAGIGTQAIAEASGLALPGSWHRHTRFTYPLQTPTRSLAAWITRDAAGNGFYALPADGGYAIGVGSYLSDPLVDDVTAATWRAELRMQTDALVATQTPDLAPTPIAHEDCWFLASPDLSGHDGWHVTHTPSVAWVMGVNLAKMAPEIARQLATG